MKSFNEWMEQREIYEPLITTNSVLFPVIHNQNVISTCAKCNEVDATATVIGEHHHG
jgi:hypothetical protein